MIYRGYDIQVPFPPGSGDCRIVKDGKLVKTFPYSTPDTVIWAWIDDKRKGLHA